MKRNGNKAHVDAGGGITVREATRQDLPLIFTFIKELAEFEKLSHAVVATEDVLLESLFGGSPSAHVLIAELDGEPVGFAVYFYNFSTFVGRRGLYIEDIYVRPGQRGSGVGTVLLKRCAGVAIENGCGRMECAVLEWNPARKFYEGMGAASLDDWIIYRFTSEQMKELLETRSI